MFQMLATSKHIRMFMCRMQQSSSVSTERKTTLMRTRKDGGFTLTEVLAVIGIIALLSAILFPVLQRARERAAMGVCLTNMTDLGTAMAQYSQDYDEQLIKDYYAFPPNCNWSVPIGNTYYTWRYALKPYVKTVETFACPQNQYQSNWNYWTWNLEYAANDNNSYFLPSSYVVNNNVIGFAGVTNDCNGPETPGGLNSQSQIEHPAKVILLSDSTTGWMDTSIDMIGETIAQAQNTSPQNYQGGIPPSYPSQDGAFQNHNGYVHFLMADGETRSMKLAASAVPNDLWDSGLSLSDRQTIVSTMPAEYN